MGWTNFPEGITSRGIPQLGASDLVTTGKVIIVNSTHSNKSDGNTGEDADAPLATIDAAVAKCRANKGDIILAAEGHTETISAAAAILADIAGITIRGLGVGNSRPKITLDTLVGTSIRVTAASVKIQNLIVIGNKDGLTSVFDIRAADCEIDVEYRDTSSAIEAETVLLTTNAADRLTAKIVHKGFVAGNACVSCVKLIGVDGARIYVDFYGKASTSIVDMADEASTNVQVLGRFHNSGTSDLSKNVKDTVGGSLWNVHGFDTVAGGWFSGGDIQAVAQDDVSTIIAALYGAGGIASFPNAAVPGDAVSLAEVLRSVWAALEGTAVGENGIVTWPAAVAPGDGVSLAEAIRYIVESLVGTLVNTGGTATLGGIIGDLANDSLLARLNDVGTDPDSATTDNLQGKLGTDTELADRSLYDQLNGAGPAVAAAAAAPANDVSLYAAVRYIVETLFGTLVNTGGTATVGGIVGDLANDSLVARLNDIGSDVDGVTTDTIQGKLGTDTEMADRSVFDLLVGDGPAVWPAAAAPANDVSLAEAIRYIVETLVGTLVNTGGTATIGGILGDVANVSAATRLTNILNQATRTTAKKTQNPIATANLFTVSGGAVRVRTIVGHITTVIQAQANACQLVHTPTGGAGVNLCATLDVTGADVRKFLTIDGVKANPMILSTDEGVVVAAQLAGDGIVLAPGTISLSGAASNSGEVDWYIYFEPLAPGATIVAV